MKRLSLILLFIMQLSLSCLIVSKPAFAEHHAKSSPHHAEKKITIGTLSLSNAFVRPTTTEKMPTAAYISINNTGNTPDKLLSIQSDVSSIIEIHNTKIDDKGVMSMSPVVGGVDLPTGKTTDFKPRGLHIMLTNPNKALSKGDIIPLVFSFEKAGKHNVDFLVSDAIKPHHCEHHDKKEHKYKDANDCKHKDCKNCKDCDDCKDCKNCKNCKEKCNP